MMLTHFAIFWFNFKIFLSKEGNIAQYYLILDLNVNVKVILFLLKNMHCRLKVFFLVDSELGKSF